MRFYDNHTHSHFSPDSRMNLQQSISKAAELGIAGISITDHLDIDAPGNKDFFYFDPIQQQAAIEELLGQYTGLEIFKGIEVGLQDCCMDKIKEFTSKYCYDVVIASQHFIDGTDPYYGEYYIGKTAEQAYSRAYEVMYKNIIDFADFDILGHYDYIARYAPYSNGAAGGANERDIRYAQYSDVLDPILKFLAQEGKALEVNTNTYRERNGYTPVLDTDILKRFRELGGEAVSLGSDAHEPWRITENFEKYAQIIADCGFKYTVHFKDRKPVFDKL